MGPEACGGREGGGRSGARVIPLLLCAALGGCSVLEALDFGGDDAQAFEFHFGWDHGLHDAKPGTKPGTADKDGVYKPETPEAESALGFPNIHASILGEAAPKARMTPGIQVEICRAKLWALRWWELQVGAGANVVDLYLGKRLVSVFEVTAGPWVGWDFEESPDRGPNVLRQLAVGGAVTIVKF